jgi:hypothetical protein
MIKTLLIKHTLPTRDNILPFQDCKWVLIVDSTGFHVKIYLGLKPKGRPKYFRGKDSPLHLRKFEIGIA